MTFEQNIIHSIPPEAEINLLQNNRQDSLIEVWNFLREKFGTNFENIGNLVTDLQKSIKTIFEQNHSLSIDELVKYLRKEDKRGLYSSLANHELNIIVSNLLEDIKAKKRLKELDN